MENRKQIQGKIEKIIYQKEDFIIAKFKIHRGPEISVIGSFPEALQGDITNLSYKLEGYYEKNKYGTQFKVVNATLTEHPLYFFLLKLVSGFTEKIVKDIFEYFKDEDIEEIIETNPERLLEVKGIGKKRLKKIIKSYKEYKPIKELSEFLLPHGISALKVIKIYTYFEDKDIVKKIIKNPYLITEVEGIGFLTADKLALSIGIDKNSPFRYEKAIEYVLQQAMNSEGHTYITKEDLIKKLKEMEITDEKLIDEVLKKNNLEITIEEDRVFFTGVKRIEEKIIEKLISLKNNKIFKINNIEEKIEQYEKRAGIKLTEKQREAVKKLGEGNQLFILSGYAGTGKTTTLKAIQTILASTITNKENIIGCAFTGIASDRLREVTGFSAKTIHSLLEWDGKNFRYGKGEKLPYKVIVLDEATMVDVFLLKNLLDAINRRTMLIMVGDPAQLPPIGAGSVFSDVVESKAFDMVVLDKILRTSKDNVITIFANEIRKGNVPTGYQRSYSDFLFIEEKLPFKYFKMDKKEKKEILQKSNENILEKVKKATKELINSKVVKDIIKDFQILSPMRKGILGTENLNKVMQKILNPGKKPYIVKDNIKFKEGDKVIHIKRNKEMPAFLDVIPKNEIEEDRNVIYPRIYNGMIGTIAYVDEEEEILFVKYSSRLYVKYTKKDLNNLLDLAYAITIHKSQGSEYNNVIIPITMSHYRMLNNQILYTGITRSKQRCIIIGHKYAFETSCKTISKDTRNTFSKLILKEMKEDKDSDKSDILNKYGLEDLKDLENLMEDLEKYVAEF